MTNPQSPAAPIIEGAVADGYRRLLAPSIERDIRRTLTEMAEAHAIQIFGTNLRSLLMQAPVRGLNVLGIDPAYRTGCKVVAVDRVRCAFGLHHYLSPRAAAALGGSHRGSRRAGWSGITSR